jgi:hypothetical protein
MAPVGAALATLALALVLPAWVIHLRGGYARAGASHAGMSFRDTGWRTRPILPLALQRTLGGDPARPSQVEREEHAWIAEVLARQQPPAGQFA